MPREAHILWHETGGAAAIERRPADRDRAGRRAVHAGRRARRAEAARPHAPAADDGHRRREHPQPGRRRRLDGRSRAWRSPPLARDLEIATFLDGARLWNAAAALGVPVAELARPFDVVSVAFSKGLGAPGGSMLGGLARVRRRRGPLPADGRRRDAPGRGLRRGRRPRPRPPSRPPGRGPRERPAPRRPAGGVAGLRSRPGDRPDEHPRVPDRGRRGRRARRSSPAPARPASSSSRSTTGRSGRSPIST